MSELIRNAEIFAAGQWPAQGANGMTFTESDLDGIVNSFNSLGLKGRIPLKMGHEGEDPRTPDGAPALGWVEAVHREGNKLLADIRLTSDKLAEMIKAGAYKFVSIELLRNVQAHTRQIPWVLDAVAILGATAPAVGILKDLQTSMSAFRVRRSSLRGTRLAFKRESANQHGDSTDMDDAAVQAAIDKAVKKATEDLSTKFTAQVSELNTKLASSEAETEKARAAAHRFAVLAPIEAGIKSGLVNAAARDQFKKLHGVDDDKLVMKATVAMADEWIAEVKDVPKFKGPGETKKKVLNTAETDDPAKLATMTRADVVTFYVEKEVRAMGGKVTVFADLEAANKRVLARNRDLALQYFDDPSKLYEPPTADNQAGA